MSNKKKVSVLLDQVSKKAKDNKGVLSDIWDDLTTLTRLLRAWVSGKYPLPKHLLGGTVVALLYFLNPLDVIPDFLMGIGYLDDVVVIRFALQSAKKELDKYRQFVEDQV